MTRYRIVLDVVYDDAHPVPDDMHEQLYANAVRCVENEELLNDCDLEAVVDSYNLRVEIIE